MKKTIATVLVGMLVFQVLALFIAPISGEKIDILVKKDMENFVPDEIIIKFNNGITNDAVRSINSANGLSIISKSTHSGFHRLTIPNGKTVIEMVEKLSKNPFVEYAEPNYIAQISMTPNDPYFSYQWHLLGLDDGGIDMQSAWDIATGSGAVVAVVDTGISVGTDLEDTCFVGGYDFVNDDNDTTDDNGHGTHVAGTVAQSTNNNLGVCGVAFNACLMPVKVLDQFGYGTYADIIDGINFAVNNGADIISMSLEGSSPSQGMEDALANAYNNGVTCVAASGNSGQNGVAYPAAYDDYVIAVGATRYDKTRAYYSNYGTSLDVVAPGGDINVDQNNDSYADGVLQQTFDPTWGYYFWQGTSMATPHVSGVAALLYSDGVTDPDDIRDALESNAVDLGSTGWDIYYGYGLINAYDALQNSTPNNPPTCTLSASPDSGNAPLTTTFSMTANDSDGTISSWELDVDNDGTAEYNGSGSPPATQQHTYNSPDTYTAELTVWDDDGATGDATQTIAVYDSMKVYYIDVGQGDSILIQTPEDNFILIDAGYSSTTVVDFLNALSITTLEALIASHPDADHIGGADEVIYEFDVLSIYHPGYEKATQAYQNFITAAESEGCPIYTDDDLDPGDYINISDVLTAQILHIDKNASSSNDASIVLRVDHNLVSFLFPGDISSTVESELIQNQDVDIDILKVAHHGSKYSTSDDFLDEATPSDSVISVGENNPYGHPTPETLARLIAHNSTIYRTDLNGTVTVTTFGTTWDITVENTTIPNNPPNTPTNPSPTDGAIDVSLSPTLSVDVSDPDGDAMDVSFYDEFDVLIGTDTAVVSGGSASVVWSGLDYSITYGWYAVADDNNGGSTTSSTWYFTTTTQPSSQNFYANSDITVQNGGISGSYVDTLDQNDVAEGITEAKTGPMTKMEHKWTIDITGSFNQFIFNIDAYHTANSEGDDFVFAYSTDNVAFTDMLTVTKTSDDDVYQTYLLPSSLSGTVYIRVKDTDQTKGNNIKDTIYVDHMYIEASNQPNLPPAMPTNPNPANGAIGVDIDPTLSVAVSDPNGDSMDVTFYDASDDSVIDVDYNIPSGGTASVVWSDLVYETTYSWYAVADDGEYTNQSPTWSFTTRSETPPGGMYVWDISWVSGPHLRSTVTIRRDSDGDGVAEVTDELVTDATVYYTLTHQPTGDFYDYVGSTDDNGKVTFTWKRAPSGTFEGIVTDVTHSTYDYNSAMDVDNPDYFTK